MSRVPESPNAPRPGAAAPPRETVYVVDDDEAVRASLRLLLGSVRIAVREFASAAAFLDATRSPGPACLIVDVRMPDLGGIELIELLRQRGDEIPAVVVTGYGDVPTTVRAFKSGAVDLLEKPFAPQGLIDVVQRLLRIDAARLDAAREKSARDELLGRLTAREHDVLLRVVEGDTNKAIAARLGISVKTVEVHRKRVMEKLEVSSVASLVTRFVARAKP